MGEHSDRYPKTQYELLMENERAIRDATAHRQQSDHAAKITANLQGQAQAAIARGVQPGRLPRIRANMSPADVAEAQAHLNEANGMSPTQARDPAFIHSQLFPATGVGAGTGLPLPAPVGARAATRSTPAAAPADQLGLPPVADARGLLTANALRKDLPTPDMNDAAAKAAAAAGTGQVVQTPYGTASSTSPAKGTVTRTDAVTTDTGVQHLTPFQQVVRNHPQVGIAGTPENLAYVRAYKAAQDAPDGEKDPVKLGLALFNPRQSPSLTGPAGELAPAQSADIKAPPAIGQPTRPVMFAGSDAGVADWRQDKPRSAASAAGETARNLATTGARAILNPVADAINTVKSGVEQGVGVIRDFFNPDAPSTPPSKPWLKTKDPLDTGKPVAPSVQVTPLPPYQFSTPSGSSGQPPMSMELPPPAGSPPLSSASGVGPWQPDADSQAFAQNPEEDLFRKRMREPSQLSYALA